MHIYLLKSYLSPFIATFFIALFVLLMQFIWKYIDDLVGKGLEWTVIMQLLFFASATFVPLALPLAVLLSSLMTMGNLGERYELAAMKAAGISLGKVMMPLVYSSILICIAAFYFSNNILPVANLKMSSLLYDVREQKPALNIKEGIYYKGIEDFVIKVNKKDDDGKTIHKVMIYDHRDRLGNTNLTIADWGKMEVTSDKKYLVFSLYDGSNYYEDSDDKRNRSVKQSFRRTKFKEEIIRFDLSGFKMKRTNEEFFKDHYQMLNLHQLDIMIDSMNKQLDKKKSEFYISTIQHLHYLPSMKNVAIPDSLSAMKKNLLAHVKKEEQPRVIELALNQARSLQNELEINQESLKSDQTLINKYQIEWHSKLTLSFACLILFFIGAPLGSIIRKGGLGWPLVISVLFFLVFHVLNTIGRKFAKEGVITPLEGIWLSSFVLFPLGIFITYKAIHDSPLLDSEVWSKITNRFFKKKKI